MLFRLVTLTIDQDRTRKDQLDAGDTVQVGDQPPTSREVFETKMNDRRWSNFQNRFLKATQLMFGGEVNKFISGWKKFNQNKIISFGLLHAKGPDLADLLPPYV